MMCDCNCTRAKESDNTSIILRQGPHLGGYPCLLVTRIWERGVSGCWYANEFLYEGLLNIFLYMVIWT